MLRLVAVAGGDVQGVAVVEDSGDVVEGAFDVAIVVAWEWEGGQLASDAAVEAEISCFLGL